MAKIPTVMDNCFIYHLSNIVNMIEEVGAILHFLLPYSPDFIPIELEFSKESHDESR